MRVVQASGQATPVADRDGDPDGTQTPETWVICLPESMSVIRPGYACAPRASYPDRSPM